MIAAPAFDMYAVGGLAQVEQTVTVATADQARSTASDSS